MFPCVKSEFLERNTVLSYPFTGWNRSIQHLREGFFDLFRVGFTYPSGWQCRYGIKYVGMKVTGVDNHQSLPHERIMETDMHSTPVNQTDPISGGGIIPDPGRSIGRAHGISNWLFVVWFMVFAMIVLGGLTRLTHSGLSMVDWRPVTGWLPPLNDLEWRSVFDLYRLIVCDKRHNSGK